MKLAIVSGFQAFIQQLKQNRFEVAKKTVENQGYTVSKKTQKTKEND